MIILVTLSSNFQRPFECASCPEIAEAVGPNSNLVLVCGFNPVFRDGTICLLYYVHIVFPFWPEGKKLEHIVAHEYPHSCLTTSLENSAEKTSNPLVKPSKSTDLWWLCSRLSGHPSIRPPQGEYARAMGVQFSNHTHMLHVWNIYLHVP